MRNDDDDKEELVSVNVSVSEVVREKMQSVFLELKEIKEEERKDRDDKDGNKFYNYDEYTSDILLYMIDFEDFSYKNYLNFVGKVSAFKIMTPDFNLSGKKSEQITFLIEKEHKEKLGRRMEKIFIKPNFSLLMSACFVRMVFDRDDLADFRDELEIDFDKTEKYIKESKEFYDRFYAMFFERVFNFDYLMSRKNGPVFDFIYDIFKEFEGNGAEKSVIVEKYLDGSIKFVQEVIENKSLEKIDIHFEQNKLKVVILASLLGKIAMKIGRSM